MAQQGKNVIISLVVGHKDIGTFSIQMLHPFYPDLHPVGQESRCPPESCKIMTHPSLSVQEIADKCKQPENQCGDDNTRPNKDCTYHRLINQPPLSSPQEGEDQGEGEL